MKIRDIKNPEARAWTQGYMDAFWADRGGEPGEVTLDDEIPWWLFHGPLETRLSNWCPYPTPELDEN